MLSRILAIFSVSLLVTRTVDGAPAVASARQILPAQPGFVPVYIRNGDTPLEEINPDLAAAFEAYSQKHARLVYGRSSNEITEESGTEVKPDSREVAKEDTDGKSLEAILPSEGAKYHHIQRIPKQ